MDISSIISGADVGLQMLATDIGVAEELLGADEASLVRAESESVRLAGHSDDLLMASAVVQQLVSEIHHENLRKVELLVNEALAVIFYDQRLEFRFDSSIKRNTTVYSCVLSRDGIEGSLHSFGGGVWAMIAVVLRLVFNRLTDRYPLVAFDESLGFLSERYIAPASEFFKEFSRRFDMDILLVTHQPLFAAEADVHYEAVDRGGVTDFVRCDGQGV